MPDHMAQLFTELVMVEGVMAAKDQKRAREQKLHVACGTRGRHAADEPT